MPSFDVGILSGQMIMFHAFGMPEIASVVAGMPAFAVAGLPGAQPGTTARRTAGPEMLPAWRL
jgi:hypothetical protein